MDPTALLLDYLIEKGVVDEDDFRSYYAEKLQQNRPDMHFVGQPRSL